MLMELTWQLIRRWAIFLCLKFDAAKTLHTVAHGSVRHPPLSEMYIHAFCALTRVNLRVDT